jgi:protein LTV1
VPAPKATGASQDAEEDSGSETEMEEDQRVTVARKKGESSEERKARKAAVKAERSVSPVQFTRDHPVRRQSS